jgi:molybdopterin-containing oxidoreductase family membrane subunit
VGTFIGTFGLFFTLFLLFVRVLPIISIGEVKSVLGFARDVHGDAASTGPRRPAHAAEPQPARPEPQPVPALALATRKDVPV